MRILSRPISLTFAMFLADFCFFKFEKYIIYLMLMMGRPFDMERRQALAPVSVAAQMTFPTRFRNYTGLRPGIGAHEHIRTVLHMWKGSALSTFCLGFTMALNVMNFRTGAMARAAGHEAQVTTRHAFTGRMCAASRYLESQRRDSLFTDPLGETLAGSEGLAQPMGEWILVPRTRYGDDFLVHQYRTNGARQLVLLGAGMDSRAYRHFATSATASPASGMTDLPELKVFEVDQQTTFDVKEPLLAGAELTVGARVAVGHDFATGGQNGWAKALMAHGFDPRVPTVWLLEGLLYYLKHDDVVAVISNIGELSAPKSSVFHDGVSKQYMYAGVAPGGAPFISGSDDYSGFGGNTPGLT